MANTFTLKSKTYDGRYMQLTCTQTTDIATNTSTISWTLATIGGSVNYYYTGPTTLTINGEQAYYLARTGEHVFPCAKGSTRGEITVPHNTDGTKAISVSFSTAIYTKSVSTYSDVWELDPIPRAATITAANNATDEENPGFTYTNHGGWNLRAALRVGSSPDLFSRTITNTGTYVFYLTEAERTTLRSYVTGSNKATLKYVLYSNNDQFTNSVDRTLTIVNGAPTISPTVIDINQTTRALTGDQNVLVRGYSRASCAINATPKKGATISSVRITNGSSATNQISVVFENVESGTFNFSATDSRANTVSTPITKTLINYFKPTCNQEGEITLSGETIATVNVRISGEYFNGSFGQTANTLDIQFRYKVGSADYTEWLSVASLGWQLAQSGSTYTADGSIQNLPYNESIIIQSRVVDKLETVTTAAYTLTLTPVFDWSNEDFRFNVPVSIQGGQVPTLIDSGMEDAWNYKKWSDGAAECWASREVTVTFPSAANWGGLFTTGLIQESNIPFPIDLFIETPNLQATLQVRSAGGLLMAPGGAGSATTNNVQTGAYEIARGTSVSGSQYYTINYMAKGRWK